MQIDLMQAKQNLTANGIQFVDENEILKDVAAANNISPQHLYLIMKEGSENQIIKIPDLPPTGTGKKTIAIFCEQYNLNADSLITYLGRQNIAADPDMKLKDVAETQEIEMLDLYNLIKIFSQQQQGDK